jgi:hypothetical protein
VQTATSGPDGPEPRYSPTQQRKFVTKDHRGSARRALWDQRMRLGGPMAGRTGRTRRPNGIGVPPKRGMRVCDEALDVAEAAAAALGITRDYYLEELLLQERSRMDANGRPTWWTKPLPHDQEELPLSESA